jgi:GNAT superfamily N-acetyltransferase
MFWRVRGKAFGQGWGSKNRAAFRRVVTKGPPPGLLAYVGKDPAGWCALAPRADYERLAHSKVLAPVDDRSPWSVTCFYVARKHRGTGLTVALLRAASEHARSRGAKILEGYPIDTGRGRAANPWVYTGLPSAFEKAGFREVERRSKTRPIMRRRLSAKR